MRGEQEVDEGTVAGAICNVVHGTVCSCAVYLKKRKKVSTVV